MLGTVIGNYRIEAEIGRGGMGVVYRARHVNMDRLVAVKALLPQFASDQEVRRRLFQEQRILDGLRHANIVALHDVYVESTAVFLVMEYIEGETLERIILDDGAMPIHRVAAMGQQILAALAHTHTRGVVHRDIKPGNIMLTRSEAKLLDFGIARARDAARLTSPELVVGSPAYLPPELWQGQDPSPPADLYALGLCLYEALMGEPALQSESGWQAFLNLHMNTDIPHLGGRLPEHFKWLADAIHTATRRDPRNRFPDGKAMLRIFRRNLGVSSELTLGGPGDPHWDAEDTAMSSSGERALLFKDEALHEPQPRAMPAPPPAAEPSRPAQADARPSTEFIAVGPSQQAEQANKPPAAKTYSWSEVHPPVPDPPPAPQMPASPTGPPPAHPTLPPVSTSGPSWILLAITGATGLALAAGMAFLWLGWKDSSLALTTVSLQVTNPLAETVDLSCVSGPEDEQSQAGLEIGPGGRGELQLVGLPAACEGTTVPDGEVVLDWTLETLRNNITTYAVRVGDPPGSGEPVEPTEPTEEKAVVQKAPASDGNSKKQQTRDESNDQARSSHSEDEGSDSSGESQAKSTALPQTETSTTSSGCANPGLLEPKALMGKLTPADIRCIEKTISKASKQTDKRDFSVVLLINADARKDTNEWMRLAERHLRDISQADPVICFKYALKLRGRGRYGEAIRWADRALENRDKFPSSTHAHWTSDLLMIRARSGNDLYKAADKKYTKSRTGVDNAAAEIARNNAKVFAKEWLDFARETGRNVDKAKKLCASAAGTTSYCK